MRWTNATAPLSLMKEKIVLPDFILTKYGTYLKHEVKKIPLQFVGAFIDRIRCLN